MLHNRVIQVLRGIMVMVMASVAVAGTTYGQEHHLELSPRWEYVSDQVMGGVSDGQMTQAENAVRLTGLVSLDNNGGFIQMAFDLDPQGASVDASDWTGFALDVRGNGAQYEVRLRTADLTRPWQSFRATFDTAPDWSRVHLPFSHFEAHRTDQTFDASALRRVGVLAIGRAFEADVSVAGVALYK